MRIREWIVIVGLGCLLVGSTGVGPRACAQSEPSPALESPANPVGPYRRVFVWESDLPLDGYQAMDLDSFRKLLDNRAKRQADLDPNSPNYDTELRALHAQARLLGADLVSDRSRLRWSWDPDHPRSRSGIRTLLAPWSPAIDGSNPTGAAGSFNAYSPPNWVYNSSGLPAIQVTSSEDWFSWTLRPQPNSTPNRLNYSFSFPRTSDSCLVLQLPKGAQVADSNVVVRSTSRWTDVTQRIGEWPTTTTSESLIEPNDSFWLLELSGRDQASFSVLLNPTRVLEDTLSSGDRSAPVWNRLIAKQSTLHTVTPHHVKSLSEWEWFESTTLDRTFRIRVPDGMRLRSLKLDDRDVAPRLSERVVELVIPQEDSNTGAASRTRVTAEFLSSLPSLASPSDVTVTVPPIECLNAYVLSGTTILAPDPSVQLRRIQAGTPSASGRLETLRSVDQLVERLDFSWFQSPPPVSFQIASRTASDTAELLARLSTATTGAVAILKIQLSPWHPSAPNLIRIGQGWTVETAQINHEGLGLAAEEIAPGAPTTLRIDPIGPVDDRRIQIELQLTRSMNDAVDGAFESESLIELPGRQCAEALAIEPGYASRLEYQGDYAYDFCDEESLTPWQRDRLPRLGRFLLFRMSNGKLPRLRWKKERGLIDCSVESIVRDHGERIQIEHRFDLSFGSQAAEPFEVQLPGTWRWEWESAQGWKPLVVKNDTADSAWSLERPNGSESGESPASGRARFRAVASYDASLATWDLPLPRWVSDKPAEHTLRADPLVQIIPESPRGVWRLDEQGELVFTWQDPVPNQPGMRIALQSDLPKDQNRWWISQCDLHVAVDTHGQQRAVLAINARGVRDETWEFHLAAPGGWSVERVVDDTARPDINAKDAFIVRPSNEGFWIRRQPAVTDPRSCDLDLRIVLAGPPLDPHSSLDWGFLPVTTLGFQWPHVAIGCPVGASSRTLWIPNGIVLSNGSAEGWSRRNETGDDRPESDRFWSAWNWTAEAFAWMTWPGSKNAASRSRSSEPLPPHALIPSWIASDWHAPVSSPGFEPSSAIPDARLYLRVAPSTAGPALWLVISTLIAFSLLKRFPWACLAMVGAATIAGHWLPDALAIWGRSTWVGCAIGTLVYLLWWTVHSPGMRSADRQRRQEPWDPWNEPGLSADNASIPNTKGALTTSLCLIVSAVTGLPMRAQDSPAKNQTNVDSVFDVLIPVDDNNTPNNEVVYVPSSIVSTPEVPLSAPRPDRDSYLISARHVLRFDGRSVRFGNTEQPCIHTYEVWVGEDGVGRPWRIPFSSEGSRLNRFLIDGLEVASSRLAKNDTSLTWYPERSGRRTLQIESQLRISPSDRVPRAWSVEAPILPSANAVLEVETDAGWTVEFDRRGRYSNPSIGKFSIQLGSQDRLSGDIANNTNPASLGSGGVATDTASLGTNESPQINTELFIDRGQLLARTIVEYPRLVDIPEEIELESDMQWQPVGNRWGDAQLTDIRPGSTLDRRRYVVRWNSGVGEGSTKRTVSTTWIPVGGSNLRNVLFAECRDRRVRPNTLRYARSAGSSWTLEGINTWVPSINTKERIEWTELIERPIATSLRIPLNGGFGVLRQQAENKLQRARVVHQWGLGFSRLSLRSRIEFANPINNRRNLIFSIPAHYIVSEVLSRSASLAHIHWVEGDRRWIQVFIDREIGEAGELVVVSEQDVATEDRLLVAAPLLAIEGATVDEQFADFSADPAWRIGMGAEPIRGKGLGKSFASIDLNQSPPTEPISIERMTGPWSGQLTATITSVSKSEWRWRLRMTDNRSLDPKPTVTLSLPTELARDWRSDAMTKELPSLDSSRRMIQIQPAWTDPPHAAAFDVEWIADPKAQRDPEWLSRVRIESDPELKCVLDEEPRDPGSDPSAERKARRSADPSAEGDCFEVHRLGAREGRSRQVHSSIWIDLATMRNENRLALQWSLPEGARVQWVSIHSESVRWSQEGNRLSIAMPPLDLPVRVDLWTDLATIEDPKSARLTVPTLASSEPHSRSGWIIAGDEIMALESNATCYWPELWSQIVRHNLEILAALHRPSASNQGLRGRWIESLGQETWWVLLSLAKDPSDLDPRALDALVTSYAAVAPQGLHRSVEDQATGHAWLPGRHSISAEASSAEAPFAVAQPGNPMDRLLATLCMGLLVVLAPWVWQALGRPMQQNPWWPLVLIGIGVWIVTGTWIPALVLTGIGLVLAVDSYLIVNGRFRQTGTRAPR